jgi:hypothetical protein
MVRSNCARMICEWRAKRSPLRVPPQSRSGGSRDAGCGRGGQRRIACIITSTLVTANAKTQPAPSCANTRPASAGPSARALFQAIDMAVMACGRSSRGTVSTTVEFQAGENSAVQQPAMKVRNSSVPGPATPVISSTASSTTVAACTASADRIRRRRSVVSARTPEGSDSRNIGRKTAVCTSAARNDEPVISTISHEAAIACIALPMK